MRDLAHDRRHLERVHAIVADAGLTPGLSKALGRMPLDAPVTMRELAALMQCDSSYITSVVDSLERHGFAERRGHPSDRRVKVIALTASGDQLARRVRDELATPPEAFAVLSDDEVRQLRDLMRMLQQAADGHPRPLHAGRR